MWEYSDPAVWSLIVTLATLFATLLFRKRILRAIIRAFADSLISEFFDPVEVKDAEGKKRLLMRPNDRAGEVLAKYGPLSAAYAMEWAKRNIKIKLPPFELPEGGDLKTLGASALASKVLSGKKLKWEDGIPLAIGYAKEVLEKWGILEKMGEIGKKAGGQKPQAPTALSPEAQKIIDKALNP
jgi:hypothetical protein